jgi:cytoskeletal protein CcmA (bactofilin family)
VRRKNEEQSERETDSTTAGSEPIGAPADRSGIATIGPSIVIRGDVSGEEDLLIQGRIDGSVELAAHSVTVGGGGRVNADIAGRVITIEGDVEGDLTAAEQIVLRGSAKVLGDLQAPRVVLEDGASFRGLVDMGALQGQEGDRAAGKATPAQKEDGSPAFDRSPAAEPKMPTPKPPGMGKGGWPDRGATARPADRVPTKD